MCIAAFFRHNHTFISLLDLMKLLNEVPGSKYVYPTSRAAIMQLFPKQVDLSYYIECKSCKIYTKTVNKSTEIECSSCQRLLKAKETNFLVFFALKDQLQREIEKHMNDVHEFTDKITRNDDLICDFHSGNNFRNAAARLPDGIVPLPIQMNTDGANVFKSNSSSIWPIILCQMYLPPGIRYMKKNMMLAGMYYGSEKPNMCNYMLPLVEEFNAFEHDFLTLSKERVQKKYMPMIISCVVDLPAKSAVQQINQYNGYHACTYCKHPGKAVKISDRCRTGVRYLFEQEKSELRMHAETLQTMRKVEMSSSNVKLDGIKGMSCMIGFKYFDIINGFGLDYMHNTLLGVTLHLLTLWNDSKNMKTIYYIPPNKRQILNDRIVSMKPCSFVIRKPRDLSKMKKYKANEIRTLLLYYLPVCLRNILHSDHLKHFLLLSSAIYALSKTSITRNDIEICRSKLILFVRDFEKFYGQHNMVMNVHLLLHLADDVQNNGPLWAQSAFAYENYNGILVRFVKGNTDVLAQISSKYLLLKHFERERERSQLIILSMGRRHPLIFSIQMSSTP